MEQKFKKCLAVAALLALTSSIFAATITVYVKDSAGNPITNPGTRVAFAGIPANSSTSTGDPDPKEMYLKPISQGKAELLTAATGHSYIVVADIPGYGPTFTEQVHSPNYPPVTITQSSDNKTINRIVYPLPASNYGTLNFNVTIPT